MSFSHSAGSPSSLNARAAGNAGTEDADISGLLRMLASVTDPRSPQGIQHALGFMLAVCVVAMLAGAGVAIQQVSNGIIGTSDLSLKLGEAYQIGR